MIRFYVFKLCHYLQCKKLQGCELVYKISAFEEIYFIQVYSFQSIFQLHSATEYNTTPYNIHEGCEICGNESNFRLHI